MSRIPPQLAKPIEHGGIIYKTEYGHNHGHDQDGGLLLAVDKKDGKSLWSILAYIIDFDEEMEKDVQEEYISRITVSHDGCYLLLESEFKRHFKVDLATLDSQMIDYDF